MPRFYIPAPIASDQTLDLPPGAARHAQVLRLQPGDAVTLFNGKGGEWAARIVRMGKSAVTAQALAHRPIEREAARAVHLAVGWMSAERLDWLIEKAVELGAASLTPIVTARTQQRLTGERADKKRTHWHAVAASASEQCGRNRLMSIHAPLPLADALPLTGALPAPGPSLVPASPPGTTSAPVRWLLSLDADATPLRAAYAALSPHAPVTLLSGPEGGFTPAEEASARAAGWQPISLGMRVLRAETAPLAVLAVFQG